jgi:hypothetical protein
MTESNQAHLAAWSYTQCRWDLIATKMTCAQFQAIVLASIFSLVAAIVIDKMP